MSVFLRKFSTDKRWFIAIPIGVFAIFLLFLFGYETGLDWRFAILGPLAGLGSAMFLVFGRQAAIPLLIVSFLIQAFISYQQQQILSSVDLYRTFIPAIVFLCMAYANATFFTRFKKINHDSDFIESLLFLCISLLNTTFWLGLTLYFLLPHHPFDISKLLLLIGAATSGQYIGWILTQRLIKVLFSVDDGARNAEIKSTVIPLWVVFGFTFLFLHLFNGEVEKKFIIQFEKTAVEVGDLIEAQFLAQDSFIDSVGTFFATKQVPVTQDNFKDYVTYGLNRYPMIQGISWLSYLRPDEVPSFTLAQRKIYPDFELRAIGSTARLVPDGIKQFYTPVTFIEPFNTNQQALGFDISSNQVRLEAIEKAISSYKMVSSAPLKLVQSQDEKMGILLLKYVPLSKNGPGLVSEVLRLEDFIGLTTQRFSEDANIRVVDVDSKTIVFDNHFDPSKFVVSKPFLFGGRVFDIDTSPTPEFIAIHNPAKYKFFMGMTAAVILSVFNSFLLLIWRFHKRVEEKVVEKTTELNQSEQQLQYVLAASGDGIWDWDIKEGKVTHNQRWLELLRLQSGDTGSTMDSYKGLIHPEDIDKVLESINIALQTGDKYQFEYRMIRGDKTLLWVSDKGMVVEHSSSGEPLRMVGAITDISAQKQAQERIEELAFFDSVTELPNRRYIETQIQRALQECRQNNHFSGLMLMDLDNFKFVNDAHGHSVGDVLLKQFGARLKGALRPMDCVSRIGGDEFLVLFDSYFASEDQCVAGLRVAVERVCEQIAEVFVIDRVIRVSIKPSIGILAFGPDAQGFKDLMTYVDLAMYSNKANRLQKYRFFDESLLDEFRQKSDLSEELIDACNSEQFYVDYQPVVNREKEIVAYEALVRWNHPKLGKLGPDRFIPFAEKNGQIRPVGNAIFNKIFSGTQPSQLKNGNKTCRLMLNLSGLHLMDADFADEFIAIVKSYHFPLDMINLEVTESVFLYDKEQSIRTMQALIKEGVMFALDDFGTGYSSFSYLQKLPIRYLKIDKTFIAGMHDVESKSIVRNIIILAHTLNLEVIAEGVETAYQYQLLYQKNCNYFQGWYCGVPGPLPPAP
jgi:diguanylate cyclase (GGDEF)-like protein